MNNWAIEPKMYNERGEERFGLTEYAELVNGRLAMVGIVGLLVWEFITGKDFLALLGF
jgi:hypothetical protein